MKFATYKNKPKYGTICSLVFLCIALTLFFLLILSCATNPYVSPKQTKMPPLPRTSLQTAKKMSSLSVISPSQRIIGFAWNCNPDANSEYFVTGLEKTTDYTNWTEVVVLPYRITNTYWLTNPTGNWFYRAFNRVK